MDAIKQLLYDGFQSTLPAGEATSRWSFNICGQPISIHASRGGSDHLLARSTITRMEFQSTLPAGEATL